MKEELLQMSQKEQSRSGAIRLYIEGYIKQKEAARRIGLSTRQVRRLAKHTDCAAGITAQNILIYRCIATTMRLIIMLLLTHSPAARENARYDHPKSDRLLG